MRKKLINRPEDCVREMTEGFLAAHGELYEAVGENVTGIKVKNVREKTALVIGGGSGHEPMFAFFVGENLADAAAAGNVFASPNPFVIYQTARSVNTGHGVLFVYGNYAGDNLNFDMAAEMLADEGIETRTVRVWDDVASAPRERLEDRRGIAGDLFVVKVAGAATGAGLSLEEAWRVTQKCRDNTFSIGVGLEGATIPGEKKPIFELPEDEMEFGLGIHGEAGVKRIKMLSADETVDKMVDILAREAGLQKGMRVCTFVNGLGSTTLMELYILNRRFAQQMESRGIIVHHAVVDSYITTQEMAGASLSVMILDDELQKYYDMPCSCAHFRKD